MNKPIRYGLAEEHLGRIYRQEDGHLVMWGDYALLAAENERLRKAGDAMYHTAQQDGTGLWLHKSFQDWNAAKEGRDAK